MRTNSSNIARSASVGRFSPDAAWRLQDGVIDASPVSIAQTTDGFLWIGTQNGLLRFDGVKFESWNDRIHELHACCALSLHGSSDGSIWIGTTNDGLYRVTNGIAEHFGQADGLSDDKVSALYEDREGDIWVATANGLDRFRRLGVVSFSSKQGCASPKSRMRELGFAATTFRGWELA